MAKIKIKNKLKPVFCVWLTGLSGSGKTTIGNNVYKILKNRGLNVEILDGDVLRSKINKKLGFSKADRIKNLIKAKEICQNLIQNDKIVIASFISPYKEIREKFKKEILNFIEVFVDCPLEICKERDEKGLYKKVEKGEIKNFTGISHPYEIPENPEIKLKTNQESIKQSVKKVISYLESRFQI